MIWSVGKQFAQQGGMGRGAFMCMYSGVCVCEGEGGRWSCSGSS